MRHFVFVFLLIVLNLASVQAGELKSDKDKISYVVGFLFSTDSKHDTENLDSESVCLGVRDSMAQSKDSIVRRKPTPELMVGIDKSSYMMGYHFGLRLVLQGVEMDSACVVDGVRESLSGKSSRVAEAEAGRFLGDYMVEVSRKKRDAAKAVQTTREEAARANGAESQEFLTNNAKNDGVVTLPSGLQYKVIRQGSGEKPTEESTVKIRFTGRFLDGTQFDSANSREVRVSGVISGWVEALQQMDVGAEWELYVPPELAYGKRGLGKQIPPNSLLAFEIELLEIVK